MRILLACLVIVAACGGSKPKPNPDPQPQKPGPEPAVSPFAQNYCDSYRACAEEKVRMSAGEEELDEAVLKEQIEAEIDACHGKTSALTPEQEAWVQSCTGCGGSCDVYRCIDEAPGVTREQTPFQCED